MDTIDHTAQGAQVETSDPVGGATGPITKAISARRSHRRQWRMLECIAMILLDTILVIVSFRLAYHLRYDTFFNNPLLTTFRYNLLGIENNSHAPLKITPDALSPFSYFQSLEIGIVIGLILIFTFRGLYKIRLTGTWFRQVWTIVSSTTLGMAFLITYYFIFQPVSNSRLLVPFVWATAILILCFARLIVSSIMGILYRLGLG